MIFPVNNCTIHRDGKFHDCAYVEARNALIPVAEAEARRRGVHPDSPGWSRMFHETMRQLAIEHGLHVPASTLYARAGLSVVEVQP